MKVHFRFKIIKKRTVFTDIPFEASTYHSCPVGSASAAAVAEDHDDDFALGLIESPIKSGEF
jgi:hypothetical protein